MLRSPPSSTLFPTRRSSDLDEAAAVGRRQAPEVALEVGHDRMQMHMGILVGERPDGLGEAFTADVHRDVTHLDRKSTRLNSSHTVISYAVFCLKKKKKKRHF